MSPPPKHSSKPLASQPKHPAHAPASKISQLSSKTTIKSKSCRSSNCPSESNLTDKQGSRIKDIAVNDLAASEPESESDCQVTHPPASTVPSKPSQTRRPMESDQSRSSIQKSKASASEMLSQPKHPRVSFDPVNIQSSNQNFSTSSTTDTALSRKIHPIPSNSPHQYSQAKTTPPKILPPSTLNPSYNSNGQIKSGLGARKDVAKRDKAPTCTGKDSIGQALYSSLFFILIEFAETMAF